MLTWKFQRLIREDSRSLYALGFHDQGVLLSRSTSVSLRETTWEMVAIYFLSLVPAISVRFDRGRSPSIANFRRQSHALMWSSDCLFGQANIKFSSGIPTAFLVLLRRSMLYFTSGVNHNIIIPQI